MPPLESFCHFDKADSRANFFQVSNFFKIYKLSHFHYILCQQSIKIGDVLIGQVQQKTFHGLAFRVVATDDFTILRDVRELAIKVWF